MEESVGELAILNTRANASYNRFARLENNNGMVARFGHMVASMANPFGLRADYRVHVEGRGPHTVNR
jgi:hypothetical protein